MSPLRGNGRATSDHAVIDAFLDRVSPTSRLSSPLSMRQKETSFILYICFCFHACKESAVQSPHLCLHIVCSGETYTGSHSCNCVGSCCFYDMFRPRVGTTFAGTGIPNTGVLRPYKFKYNYLAITFAEMARYT